MEVAGQRVEHVLPGPDSAGVAQLRGLAGGEGADQIGQEAAGREVAAADDVARAHRGHADAGVGWEVAGAVGLRDDLGAGLAGAVGIVPAERVAFRTAPIGPEIALVAGNHDDRAQRR